MPSETFLGELSSTKHCWPATTVCAAGDGSDGDGSASPTTAARKALRLKRICSCRWSWCNASASSEVTAIDGIAQADAMILSSACFDRNTVVCPTRSTSGGAGLVVRFSPTDTAPQTTPILTIVHRGNGYANDDTVEIVGFPGSELTVNGVQWCIPGRASALPLILVIINSMSTFTSIVTCPQSIQYAANDQAPTTAAALDNAYTNPELALIYNLLKETTECDSEEWHYNTEKHKDLQPTDVGTEKHFTVPSNYLRMDVSEGQTTHYWCSDEAR